MKEILKSLINILKGQVLKLALINLVKSGPFMGVRKWFIKIVINHFFDDIAEPIIEYGLRRLQYSFDKKDGKVIIKKIEDAKNENDVVKYNDAVDSIFK